MSDDEEMDGRETKNTSTTKCATRFCADPRQQAVSRENWGGRGGGTIPHTHKASATTATTERSGCGEDFVFGMKPFVHISLSLSFLLGDEDTHKTAKEEHTTMEVHTSTSQDHARPRCCASLSTTHHTSVSLHHFF